MSIKQRLQADIKQAMLAKDKSRTTLLRLAMNAILVFEKDKLRDATEDETVTVLRKHIGTSQEELEGWIKRGDQANQDRIKADIEALQAYLPQQLSDAEVSKVVDRHLAALQASGEAVTLPILMKAVRAEIANNAEGSTISSFVKSAIACQQG